MAIQRIDPGGFDIGSTTTLLLNGGFNNSNTLVGITNAAPAGRSNSNAYTTSVNNSFLGWFLSVNFNETIMGFAFYNPSLTFTNNLRLCSVADGATNQVDVRTDATGHFFFTRNGTSISSSSVNALSVIGWYYIEFKSKISTTVGTAEVRVKAPGGLSSVWLSISGANTQASVNAFVNEFFVISRGAVQQYWKDIYFLDTGTGIYRDYLGDITVKTLYPRSGDATYQQWAPNTGTQVSCVQDGITHAGTYPDGDTTFISDTVSGDISAFQVDTLLQAGAIYGVVHAIYARTASTGTINEVLVQNGAVVKTGSTITLTTSYLWYQDVSEQNPVGPVPWSSMFVNMTHPGSKIQAASASARVSQELLMVIISNTVAEISSQPHVWISTD